MKQEHLRKGNRTIGEGKGGGRPGHEGRPGRARGAVREGTRGGPGGHKGRPAPLKVASWGTGYTIAYINLQIMKGILKIIFLNPCPAEPGYTLPLQTM